MREYTQLRASCGYYRLPGALVISNGAVGGDVGGVHFDKLALESEDPPLLKRPGVSTGRGKVIVRDLWMPPRGLYTIRTGRHWDMPPQSAKHLPRFRRHWQAHYDTRAELMRAAIEAGQPAPWLGLYSPSLGPYQPLGQNTPYAHGGEGIEPLSGWDQSSAYHLLCADLTMERQAPAYTDQGGNILRTADQFYHLNRGWTRQLQLAQFCEPIPGAPVWEDRRLPRQIDRPPAYAAELAKYLPHDGSHLIRAYRHADACWRIWGDAASELYLEMIAADAGLAYTEGYLDGLVTGERGKGSSRLNREFGWVMEAQSLVGADTARYAHACAWHQMPNGMHQRVNHGEQHASSPDPWLHGGVPTNVSVGNARENGTLAWALSRADMRQVERVARAITRRSAPLVWSDVARDGKPTRALSEWWGSPETFHASWTVGLMLEDSKGSREWRKRALALPPPGSGTPAKTLRELRDRIANGNPALVGPGAQMVRALDLLNL